MNISGLYSIIILAKHYISRVVNDKIVLIRKRLQCFSKQFLVVIY